MGVGKTLHFSNTHNWFSQPLSGLESKAQDERTDLIFTKSTQKFKILLFVKLCHLLIWNLNGISTWREQVRLWPKKKRENKTAVMKSPGVTWLLAVHTLCLLVCLSFWFSLCWHQSDHDNSVRSELCHLQPHRWLVDAVVVTVKLRLRHL